MLSHSTRPSLLARVRDPADERSWREFEALYGELILRYCLRRGLQLAQAEDVRQVALLGLAQTLPRFHYDPRRGRFRGYVGRVVRNAIVGLRQRHEPSPTTLDRWDAVPDVSASDEFDEPWEREWTAHHARRALVRVRELLEPRSVEVFDRLLSGATIAETAARFGLSPESVRKIKQRVRERLTTLIREQIATEDQEHGGAG